MFVVGVMNLIQCIDYHILQIDAGYLPVASKYLKENSTHVKKIEMNRIKIISKRLHSFIEDQNSESNKENRKDNSNENTTISASTEEESFVKTTIKSELELSTVKGTTSMKMTDEFVTLIDPEKEGVVKHVYKSKLKRSTDKLDKNGKEQTNTTEKVTSEDFLERVKKDSTDLWNFWKEITGVTYDKICN